MKHSLLPLILAGTFAATAQAAPVVAVNLSGDYGATTSFNNTLSQSTGDYDFGGTANDRRSYQNIDTVLTAASPINPFAAGAPTRTSTVRAGFQAANMDTLTDPTFGNRRLGENAAGDLIQLTSGAGTNAMRLASAVNVAKAGFLNGASSGSLSFANQVGSAVGGAITMTSVGSPVARLLVQNGASWYISNSSRTNAGALTLNGYTESWYAYDPSSNIFYNNAALGSSVLGSTFTDIQAFGMIVQTTANFDGTAANAAQFAIRDLSLTVVPEPSSALLLAGGIAGLAMLRRIRRK